MDEIIKFLKYIDNKMKLPNAKIFQLHFERNRYIFDILKTDKLSKKDYKMLVKYDLIDHYLISYWKKPGFENLCCLRCIQPVDHKYNNVCKCRIPIEFLNNEECDDCGCTGCSW